MIGSIETFPIATYEKDRQDLEENRQESIRRSRRPTCIPRSSESDGQNKADETRRGSQS